jgi:hypothetical protein
MSPCVAPVWSARRCGTTDPGRLGPQFMCGPAQCLALGSSAPEGQQHRRELLEFPDLPPLAVALPRGTIEQRAGGCYPAGPRESGPSGSFPGSHCWGHRDRLRVGLRVRGRVAGRVAHDRPSRIGSEIAELRPTAHRQIPGTRLTNCGWGGRNRRRRPGLGTGTRIRRRCTIRPPRVSA